MEMDERIVAAAIRQGAVVCSVAKPGRHHHVIHALAESGVPIPINGEQGFLTNQGRFVSREAALWIARSAGQVKRRTRHHRMELFSEDLW